VLLLEQSKLVVEGAGAVATAALLAGRVEVPARGTTVAVLSGGFNVGDANHNGLLDYGETWVYTATTTVPYGPSYNTVDVNGTNTASNEIVWANDTNYKLGVTPKITVVKAVDAFNPLAPTAVELSEGLPGRELLVGTTAVWTYLVKNTGDVPVSVTAITDNNGTTGVTDDFTPVPVMQGGFVVGDTNQNGVLDPGETWLYRATTTVQTGIYMNTVNVTAFEPVTNQTATASNVSGYYGETSAQGLTPGFWKNHPGWPAFSMTQLVSSVFCTTQVQGGTACTLPADAVNETLEAALGNGGGGTDALLRHAVAALLSSASANVDYPWTDAQIVSAVDAAIASGNATNVNNLEAQLAGWNQLEANLPPPNITPTASISSASLNEGNSGTTNATFTVTLSFALPVPVTIAWATADGTATVANNDYTASAGMLTFAAGQTTATLSVSVIGDTFYEPNETFNVVLSNPQGATIAIGTGTGTIVNDDAAPSFSVAATTPTAVESPSQAGVYTITRTGNLSGPVTLNLSWGGTAASTRYTLTATGGTLSGTQLTLPSGGASATITLKPVADGKLEPAQTAVLTIATGTTYVVGSPTSATVTLYDTTAPTVSITPTTMTKAGSTSNQTLTFTITLSGSSPNTTGVTVKTADGTAKAGTDYTLVSTTLSFAPGVTSRTLTVTLLGRKTGTLTKTFTVGLSAATGGATLGTTTSTVSITGTSAQVAAATAPISSAVMPLTEAQLQPVVVAAERMWAAAGASPAQLAADRFVITTALPFGEVGFTDGNTIYIDPIAAGWGWNTSLALPSADQMDLLTVVLHEIGHTIGLPDGCACGSYNELMQATLPAGVRRQLSVVSTISTSNARVPTSSAISPSRISSRIHLRHRSPRARIAALAGRAVFV